MSELRRLLISRDRITTSIDTNYLITLEKQEIHYLRRVLRLKVGDSIDVVDGKGRAWRASFLEGKKIKLQSSFDQPLLLSKQQKPLLGIAVVVPKKNFDQVIRMSCEIGIDLIQPLSSQRSINRHFTESRFYRWDQILTEAVEQSERLWKPELRPLVSFPEWLKTVSKSSVISFGTTRSNDATTFESFLKQTTHSITELWLAIGPEGGWTNEEINLANLRKCKAVVFNKNILTTSTAAVAASQIMIEWRSKFE